MSGKMSSRVRSSHVILRIQLLPREARKKGLVSIKNSVKVVKKEGWCIRGMFGKKSAFTAHLLSVSECMWVSVPVCVPALIIDRATREEAYTHRFPCIQGSLLHKCVCVCMSAAVTSDINCTRKTGASMNISGYFSGSCQYILNKLCIKVA